VTQELPIAVTRVGGLRYCSRYRQSPADRAEVELAASRAWLVQYWTGSDPDLLALRWWGAGKAATAWSAACAKAGMEVSTARTDEPDRPSGPWCLVTCWVVHLEVDGQAILGEAEPVGIAAWR
jgi:hypothetical protein